MSNIRRRKTQTKLIVNANMAHVSPVMPHLMQYDLRKMVILKQVVAFNMADYNVPSSKQVGKWV